MGMKKGGAPDEPGIWVFEHEGGFKEDIPIIIEAIGPKVWDLVPYGDELPGKSLADFRGQGRWIGKKSDLPGELSHLGEQMDLHRDAKLSNAMGYQIDENTGEKYPVLTFYLKPEPGEVIEKDPTGKGRVLVCHGADTFFWCPLEMMEWMQKTADMAIEGGRVILPSDRDELFPENAPAQGAIGLWDLWEEEGIERIRVE